MGKEEKKRKFLMTFLVIIFCLLLLWAISKFGKIENSVAVSTASDTIQITENNINFNQIKDLNIFANPEFEYKKVIVPMAKSAYTFVVTNNLNEDVEYKIKMQEDNDLHINMKYKLKKNNNYIIGDENNWMSTSQLNFDSIKILKKSSDVYTLEWYWEDSQNDTDIGKKAYAEYKLHINLNAQLDD